MKDIFIISALFLVFLLPVKAQQNRYLQLDLNAGISQPVQGFSSPQMFAGQGISAGAGFDYFFGKMGIGFNAGYFTNPSDKLFRSFVSQKYLENISVVNSPSWKTSFGMMGPVFKSTIGKFEFDVFLKGGFRQIQIPELYFTKAFSNQSFDVYRFSGTSDDWQFAWSTGVRMIYKLNSWMGLQIKADYFTTAYKSNISYENSYRDASDGNRNGKLEDSEYLESQRITKAGNVNLTALNLNMGLVLQLGKFKNSKVVQMMPETIVPEESEIVINQDTTEQMETALIDTVTTVLENLHDNAPVVNVKVEPTPDSEHVENNDAEEVMPEAVEIPATTYDAPESRYDEEAAAFLYKAGESYFAANDFENAMPCFNKLKADPKYPRAKYMFALSLCSMGNCAEARKEYKEFAKVYTGDDARTLEIIFASHAERCKISGRLIPLKDAVASEMNQAGKPDKVEKNVIISRYKIQFIAIKKPNKNFPKLVSVGNISTEFYPNKSVFRYTLGEYEDLKSATEDVYKVRKMGFRDAFIAVYDHGQRVNTLYHAK